MGKLTEKQFNDMVQERNDFEGSSSLNLRGHFERLAAIAQYDRPAPAEVKEDVITRGMDEYFRVSKTPYSYPPNVVAGFNAFANVLLDALRGPVTEEERKQLVNNGSWPEVLTKFLESRISRILKPKEKTAEEKVQEILHGRGIDYPTLPAEIVAVLKSGDAK